ncbi:HCLS1-binding protein 3 isoform X2 [Halichoerus grypus]
MMSGHVEYQILVVTRLAAFKSAKHRPEDVVQFLVSKKYSEIEEFYQKLSSRYPTSSLPPLPKKVLFVGESDIRERRAVFNEILRCVSKDAELAGSPELLEFLGTRSPGAVDLTSRDVSVLDAHSQAQDDGEAFDFFEQQDRAEAEGLPISGRKGEDARNSSEEEEEEALDPLGIMRSKKSKKRPEVAVKPKPSPRLTIFDEEVDPDEGLFGPSTKFSPQRPAEDVPLQDPLKLFEDPDLGGAVPLGDPLLLPAAGESGGPVSHAELFSCPAQADGEDLLQDGTVLFGALETLLVGLLFWFTPQKLTAEHVPWTAPLSSGCRGWAPARASEERTSPVCLRAKNGVMSPSAGNTIGIESRPAGVGRPELNPRNHRDQGPSRADCTHPTAERYPEQLESLREEARHRAREALPGGLPAQLCPSPLSEIQEHCPQAFSLYPSPGLGTLPEEK